MSTAPDSPVYEWPKNGRGEVVRAALTTFGGRRLIDLRVYYTDADGALKPTKKGVSIAVEQLGELETAVQRLRAALAERREGS